MNSLSFRTVLLVFGLIPVLASLAMAHSSGSRPVIDTALLIDELTDLRTLSVYPDPAFICRQFSSHDPKSVSPEQDWFANGDRGHYLRVEEVDGRKEHVMMDAAGPGAVVRIWSANPQGTMRVYVDGAAAPVIEAPMTDFLSGKTEGFPFPIAHTVSKGWNTYFPVPYAKHCKITSDKGDFYYQINYRTYDDGAAGGSFENATPLRLKERIAAAAAILDDPGGLRKVAGNDLRDRDTRTAESTLQTGDCTRLKASTKNGSAVEGLEFKVEADDMEAALRGLVLSMTFDGLNTVQIPLGDFVGTAPGASPYASLPAGVDEDGTLWSRWWMPFGRTAAMEIVNRGADEVGLRATMITRVDVPWNDNSMYFHAKWRIEKQIPTRPMKDWNYIDTKGKGVFVGDALYVSNPVKNWWGEGDEKIYVDGETFPSHFGTGTEDYYGYAWCWPGLFAHAYHNQPRCDGPNNYGHTAVNRWHIVDRIPFETSFRFDMEVWHWADVNVDYAVACFWYAFEGQTDTFTHPAAKADNLVVDRIEPYVIRKVEGAQEGEELEVLSKTGIVEKQGAGNDYSGEAQLWWREAKVGDELVLAFESAESGPHQVIVVLTEANDYGIHELAVNGRKIGKRFDLYRSSRWGPTEEIALGVFDLTEGKNSLSVTIVGANEAAIKNYMFGIDYVRVTP